MRIDISFAGIALSWSNDYARSYCEKLVEMGFSAKLLDPDGGIVAYSPLPFSRAEAIEAYRRFIEGVPDISAK